jgi:hypothetical protein
LRVACDRSENESLRLKNITFESLRRLLPNPVSGLATSAGGFNTLLAQQDLRTMESQSRPG